MFEDDWLTIGKIVGAQGLKGEIRVNPESDFPERFKQPGKRWIQKSKNKPEQVSLLSGRQLPGKSIYVIRLQEIGSRFEAELLIGSKMLVRACDRPKLKDNEFHLLDLVGLKVFVNNRNYEIGKVSNLTSAGNDLLEIQLFTGKKVLIPFVKPIVPIVNLEEGWIILTPPEGLLDL